MATAPIPGDPVPTPVDPTPPTPTDPIPPTPTDPVARAHGSDPFVEGP